MEKLRVCFVCTGNRARSPIAEHAFRNAAGDYAEVDSAGILDLDGAPALPEAVAAAGRLGIDLSRHTSKALLSIDPATVDLLVGFELNHVADATVEAGFPREKVFTLPELVRLLRGATSSAEQGPERRARDLLRRAASRRSTSFDVSEQVADPLGRPTAFFDETATRVRDTCTELARLLFERDDYLS